MGCYLPYLLSPLRAVLDELLVLVVPDQFDQEVLVYDVVVDGVHEVHSQVVGTLHLHSHVVLVFEDVPLLLSRVQFLRHHHNVLNTLVFDIQWLADLPFVLVFISIDWELLAGF